ncbi:sugar transferase [Schaalia suimastitidis]|uniref:sugar transferase n=1 Tax=Schaalia suimastitidis TaxID=121163 RepID=UPI00042A6E62|nr:exopolysaccharide biosynthesis polyprenyl glycosylphosphotransferase [Schaalia suimastitidis]
MWTPRRGAPVGTLLLADTTLIGIWLAIHIGPPALKYHVDAAPSVIELIHDLGTSTQFSAYLLGLTVWFLALLLCGTCEGREVASPFSSPRYFILLAVTVFAFFHAAHTLFPAIADTPPHTFLGIPLLIVALTHIWARFRHRRIRARITRAMLLAPEALLLPLSNHISQYGRSLGVTVVGVMGWDDHIPLLTTSLSDRFDEIANAMRDCGATVLLLSPSALSALSDLQDLRWQLENEGFRLDVVLEPTCLGASLLDIESAPGIAVIATNARKDTLLQAFIKRSFDLCVSSILIVLLTPLWLYLIVAIRRDDNGPAFFLQERVGRGGRTFPMVKFRTMVIDAEARLQELRAQEEARRSTPFVDDDDPDTGVLFKLKNDPRITRMGHFLRRTSIDELPQLFNVWWGHMSLVGPRPPLPREVEQYLPRVMRKFNVRPGMTGLWQVSGRSDLSWAESVRLDLHYVENRSFRFDLKILFKTFKAVLQQDGAY